MIARQYSALLYKAELRQALCCTCLCHHFMYCYGPLCLTSCMPSEHKSQLSEASIAVYVQNVTVKDRLHKELISTKNS